MKKILAVDNHPVLLKFVTDLCTKNGHEIITATDGLSALEHLETFVPDVMFIDLVMPNISGDKLCQIIRDKPAYKNVFLVILSGIAIEEVRDFKTYGAETMIAKGPFNKMADHILNILDHLEKNRQMELKGKILGLGDLYRREITSELLASKKHFEKILNNMAEGIVEINPDSKIVYANPAAIDIIQLPEAKLLSLGFPELFGNDDQDSVKALLKHKPNGDGLLDKENNFKLDSKQVSINVIHNFDGDKGNPAIVILTDISRRWQMEAQLRQAQKMEAVATLAGGIAHQFNNALTTIVGNMELLELDYSNDATFLKRIGYMAKSTDRMAKLTQQLLAYSRGGKYRPKTATINDILIDVLPLVKNSIDLSVQVVTELAPEIPDIKVDVTELQMVMSAVINNAAEAISESGHICIMTKVQNVDEKLAALYHGLVPGRYVLLSIEDDGKGMDKETVNRIFEPFFTTSFQGRGLGMAAVYGIIKNHGGWIGVTSQPGKGTTVNIYLPAVVKERATKSPESLPVATDSKTVIVIDDEELVMRVCTSMLKKFGYRTLEAGNAEAAIRLIKDSDVTIDLALLDIGLPDMDGETLFGKLIDIRPGLKVVICSGNDMNGPGKRLLDAGAVGYIQKPFQMKELSREIEKYLKPEAIFPQRENWNDIEQNRSPEQRAE